MSTHNSTVGAAPTRKPNILWVVTTQWRAQATGYAGDANARTPALDALALEALNFTQAVTPHPFGPFARAALLTGIASPENGVRDYFDSLPLEARTIAHDLGERGYATAFFGKWHLGKRDRAAPLVGEVHARTVVPPEARGGFEFWEGFESGFLLNDPWLHGTRLSEPVKFAGYQSDVICERAGDWVVHAGQQAARPWFCVVSVESPHPPYDAPAAGVKATEAGKIILPANVPQGGDAEQKARRELAGYYTHIEATDRAIGRMLDGIKAAGVESWDNTVVVFTSAHGDMHGAHGAFRKGWPHEESVRVPLLVKLPIARVAGRTTGETRSDAVSLVDSRAMTLGYVEQAGAPLFNAGTRGPLGAAEISMPSVVALPHQCDRVWRGVRTAKRKLVLNEDGSPWLFFDLENDPLEMRNLVGEPQWVDEIREMARSV